MLVGRYALTEQHQTRISVAIADVPQHLVIGAVFLDKIKDIFYRRLISYFHRHGVTRLARGNQLAIFGIRRILIDQLRILSKQTVSRLGDDAHRPLEESRDVLNLRGLVLIAMLKIDFLTALGGVWSQRVGLGSKALAVGHPYLATDDAYGGWIPADRNEPFGTTRSGIADIEHR